MSNRGFQYILYPKPNYKRWKIEKLNKQEAKTEAEDTSSQKVKNQDE